MKKFFVCLMCLLCCAGVNLCFAYTDLIDALNKTYQINGEDFALPIAIKTKAINYIKANDITKEQCDALMDILNKGIDFANEVGTTDISKLTAEQLKQGIAIVNEAASVLKMEVKVNSTLDKVVATEKDTGKIVEEVEKKDVFFKATGKDRNTIFWCSIAFCGLIVIIIAYVILTRMIKFPYIDIICNTVMLLYIVCAMPLICFGNYIEMLDLLKPVLSSEVGEGHIEIIEVEIKEPVSEPEKVPEEEAHTEKQDNNKDEKVNSVPTVIQKEEPKVEEPKVEQIKYPVLGEMYAKLEIPSCNINLSVYYGDNENILDIGVGHFSGSHFPGQGKGILYTTHNTPDKLYNLKNVKVGDLVNIVTNFGKFTYKVTSIEVVKDTDKDKAYIESNKELLMIYTCYPFDAEGYTDERYMVYCERSNV